MSSRYAIRRDEVFARAVRPAIRWLRANWRELASSSLTAMFAVATVGPACLDDVTDAQGEATQRELRRVSSEPQASSPAANVDSAPTAPAALASQVVAAKPTSAIAPTDAAHAHLPAPSPDFSDVLSSSAFGSMFLHKGDATCEGADFSYQALVEAVQRFPNFAADGSLEVRKREVAAFLAHLSHETSGGWTTAPDGPFAWGLCFLEETACKGSTCKQYCLPSSTYPCLADQSYHGRGPMRLAGNDNYGAIGAFLGADLLATPDLVIGQPRIGWETALWLWMTPQGHQPSAHDVMAGIYVPTPADQLAQREPGFGLTINLIDGYAECGQTTPAAVQDRLGYYLRYVEILETTAGNALTCERMQPYP